MMIWRLGSLFCLIAAAYGQTKVEYKNPTDSKSYQVDALKSQDQTSLLNEKASLAILPASNTTIVNIVETVAIKNGTSFFIAGTVSGGAFTVHPQADVPIHELPDQTTSAGFLVLASTKDGILSPAWIQTLAPSPYNGTKASLFISDVKPIGTDGSVIVTGSFVGSHLVLQTGTSSKPQVQAKKVDNQKVDTKTTNEGIKAADGSKSETGKVADGKKSGEITSAADVKPEDAKKVDEKATAVNKADGAAAQEDAKSEDNVDVVKSAKLEERDAAAPTRASVVVNGKKGVTTFVGKVRVTGEWEWAIGFETVGSDLLNGVTANSATQKEGVAAGKTDAENSAAVDKEKGSESNSGKSKPVSDSKKPGQPDDSGKSKDSAAKQQEAVGEAFKAEAEAGESAANKKVEGGKGSSSPKKAVDGQGKGVNEPAVAPGKDAASKEAIDAAKEHEAVGEAFKAEAEEKVADKKGKGSKETIPKVPTVEVPGDSAVPDASNKDIAAAKKHEAVGEAFKAEAEGKTGAAVNDKSGNGADKKVTDGSKGKSESFSGKVGELVDAKDASAKQDKDKNTASKSLKVETTVKASDSTKGTGGKVEKPSKANGEAIGDIEGEEEVYGEEDVSDEAVAKSKAEGYVSVPKNGGLYERKRRAEAEVKPGVTASSKFGINLPTKISVDAEGNIWVAGSFSGSLDVGLGTALQSVSNVFDGYVLKLSGKNGEAIASFADFAGVIKPKAKSSSYGVFLVTSLQHDTCPKQSKSVILVGQSYATDVLTSSGLRKKVVTSHILRIVAKGQKTFDAAQRSIKVVGVFSDLPKTSQDSMADVPSAFNVVPLGANAAGKCSYYSSGALIKQTMIGKMETLPFADSEKDYTSFVGVMTEDFILPAKEKEVPLPTFVDRSVIRPASIAAFSSDVVYVAGSLTNTKQSKTLVDGIKFDKKTPFNYLLSILPASKQATSKSAIPHPTNLESGLLPVEIGANLLIRTASTDALIAFGGLNAFRGTAKATDELAYRGAWMGVLNLKGVTAYADEFASAGDKSVVSGAKAGENVDGESNETYGDKKATSDGGKKAVVSEKAKAIIATVAAVAPTPAATAKASVDEPKKESMYEDESEEPASDVVEVPESVKPLPKPDVKAEDKKPIVPAPKVEDVKKPAPDEKKPFVPPPPPPQDDKKPFIPVSPPDAEYEEDIIEDDTTPKKNIFEEAVAGDDVKAAESDEASYIGSGVYVFAIIAAFAAVGVFLFCSAKKLKVGPASSPFEYIMNGITLIFNPSPQGKYQPTMRSEDDDESLIGMQAKDVSNFQPHHTVGTVEPIAKPGINILAPVKRKTSLGVSPETSIPIESKSVDHNAANDGGWDWEGDDFGEPSVAGQPRKSKDGRGGKDSNDWGDDF